MSPRDPPHACPGNLLKRVGLPATVLCALLSFSPSAGQTPAGTEIVNVATSSFEMIPAGVQPGNPPELVSVDSNPVMTMVLGVDCFAEVRLEVDPQTTVAPGSPLRYTVMIENGNGTLLDDVVVEMPLAPLLMPPMAFTDGTASKIGGGSVACTASYDPLAHTIVWTIPALGAEDAVELGVITAVREGLAADTWIAQLAQAFSAACPGRVDSNVVNTAVVPPVLEVGKIADRSTAAIADGVVYTIDVAHVAADPPLDDVVLIDTLPADLRFVPGSLRVDGLAAPDPQIDPGGQILRLPLGPLIPGESRRITLATIVAATARQGEAINRARAEATTVGGAPIASNLASAAISIVQGAFRREAYLLGRVFVDDDADGMPDPDEPGVPGALVLMENGRGAITDITGRWHIEAVQPGLHVLRVDPSTLPMSLSPMRAGVEWAGDRSTRFVEARAGTLVVADMPIGPDHAPRCVFASRGLRLSIPLAALVRDGHLRAAADGHLEAASSWFADNAPAPSISVSVDCGADDGTIAQVALEMGDRFAEMVARRSRTAAPSKALNAAQAASASAEGVDFEQVLRTLPPTAAILSPRSGALADRARINIDVVYPAGSIPRLTLNGTEVSSNRVGTSAVLESRAIAASRYVGIPLQEGVNHIELQAGETVRSTVLLAGAPVELRVALPEDRWIADGVTQGVLEIEAVDGTGKRSPVRLVVTLEADGAWPTSADFDPKREGFQVRLRDGRAEVRFAPHTLPGRIGVVVSTDEMEVERFVDIRPGGDTWRVIGLVEAHVAGDAGVEGDGGMAPGLDDGISDDGGRVAVFARGPVGDASRLTVSLDTGRDRDRDRLENTYEPDRFYPVSGDSGLRTDEAASQGKLFARIDGPRGHAQWGDFATGFNGTELSRYDRRMTGASGRTTYGRTSFEGFASSTDQRVARDVFEADGSSGPFLLSTSPVVARSETIVVEVRDRFQTDKVLSRQIKRRDLDYHLDPLAGSVLFRGPIAAFDADLNPVRVVVLYESRTGAADQITAGGRFAYRAGERVEVGASAVSEERAGENLTLYGVDISWRPAPGTVVSGEVAATHERSSATAVALEVRSRPRPELAWEASYRDLPSDFSNPTYLGSPELASKRYGASVQWQPDGYWRIKGETFVQEDARVGLDRFVAGAEAERRIGGVTAVGGIRSVSTDSAAQGETSSTLVKAGIRGRLADRLTGELIREQALGGETAPGYPTRTTAGLSYEIYEGTRAFVRQELESGDGPDRDRTVVGVESKVGAHTRAALNYSLDGAGDATALRSLAGVDTVFPINDRNSVSFSAARLHTTGGDDGLDYSSLGAGYEYSSGSYLASSRYELRLGEQDNRHVLTISGAFHPREEWTFFVRERLFVTEPDSAGSVWRAEGLFGTAYRPYTGPWRFLARLDHSTSNGVATTAGGTVPGTTPSEPSSSVGNPQPTAVSPGIGFGPGRGLPERGAMSISVAAGARLSPKHRLATSITVRHVEGDRDVGLPAALAHLISLHYTAQIGERWTAGGSLRRLGERETRTASWGHGVEVGYLVLRNLWLTGGYNFAGFDDDRFPGAERSERGPFLSLRFKFDERSVTRWSDLRLDR